MKPIPDCVPDALNMIIATAKAVSDDDFIHRKVLLKVMGELADDGDLGTNPAELYLQCWETACRALGVKDPYENEKARGDKVALGVLKILAERFPIPDEDRLRTAIKVSFAGAMLDYSGLGRSDMQEQVVEYYQTSPFRDDTDALVAAVEKADSVMLVANRAGEVALDMPLAEEMAARGKKVFLAVAAKPVFLMATEKDAENVGFSADVSVVNPGTAMYGLVQERASSEFRDLLNEVETVIVKGCTHFSTMSRQRDLFFILKAIEEEVAAKLDMPPAGGAIVKMPAEGR